MSDRKIIYLDDAIDALKKEQAHYAHEDGAEIFYEYRHAIKALKNLPSAQSEVAKDINVPNNDTISRQAAIKAIEDLPNCYNGFSDTFDKACIIEVLEEVPSAQPEPLSHAYAKYVLTWLIDYQIKTAELQGRYSPYEVLSWVANDWRKENE